MTSLESGGDKGKGIGRGYGDGVSQNTVVLSFFKTPGEREQEAARKALAQQYEREVLLPAGRGQTLLEEAEADFNRRHGRVMQELFGPEAGGDLAKLYEREVLLRAGRGEISREEAEADFRERHRQKLLAAVGPQALAEDGLVEELG